MARATIKYGNVYLLARRSSSSRSCLVSTILYGLFRGKLMPSRQQYNRVGDKRHIIRYRIYGEKYLGSAKRNYLCQVPGTQLLSGDVKKWIAALTRTPRIRTVGH